MKALHNGLKSAAPQDVFLGIDQSLTAFGLTMIGSSQEYSTWVYTSKFRGVTRLVDIRDWVRDRIGDVIEQGHEVVGAAMESGVVSSHSSLVLGELSATVKLMLFDDFRISDAARYPLQVPPSVLKKYITGRGNASKHEVILATYKTWGVEFVDDNAADSYGLARLAAGFHNNAIQRDVYTKIADHESYRDPAYVGLYAGT